MPQTPSLKPGFFVVLALIAVAALAVALRPGSTPPKPNAPISAAKPAPAAAPAAAPAVNMQQWLTKLNYSQMDTKGYPHGMVEEPFKECASRCNGNKGCMEGCACRMNRYVELNSKEQFQALRQSAMQHNPTDKQKAQANAVRDYCAKAAR